MTAFAGETDWSLARPLPALTLEIRKAIGLALLIPAGQPFVPYTFPPCHYVRPGVADSPDRLVSGRLAVATCAIAALTFAAGLRCAGVWFRAPPVISRAFLWSAAIGVAWIGFSAAFLRPRAVLVPAFLLMCV